MHACIQSTENEKVQVNEMSVEKSLINQQVNSILHSNILEMPNSNILVLQAKAAPLSRETFQAYFIQPWIFFFFFFSYPSDLYAAKHYLFFKVFHEAETKCNVYGPVDNGIKLQKELQALGVCFGLVFNGLHFQSIINIVPDVGKCSPLHLLQI